MAGHLPRFNRFVSLDSGPGGSVEHLRGVMAIRKSQPAHSTKITAWRQKQSWNRAYCCARRPAVSQTPKHLQASITLCKAEIMKRKHSFNVHTMRKVTGSSSEVAPK